MRGRVASTIPWMAAIAWMAVIFALSSVPGGNMPGRFSELGHLGVYAVLGGLLMLALTRGEARPMHILWAVLLASVYGVTDELHQAFVPGRMPDPVDWVLDTIGALIGASAMYALLRGARKSG